MVCAASYREDHGPQTLFSLICKKKKKNLCTLRKYEMKNYPSAQQRPISRNWIFKRESLDVLRSRPGSLLTLNVKDERTLCPGAGQAGLVSAATGGCLKPWLWSKNILAVSILH